MVLLVTIKTSTISPELITDRFGFRSTDSTTCALVYLLFNAVLVYLMQSMTLLYRKMYKFV